jgi:uroporphyrinogen-III decarboxylase
MRLETVKIKAHPTATGFNGICNIFICLSLFHICLLTDKINFCILFAFVDSVVPARYEITGDEAIGPCIFKRGKYMTEETVKRFDERLGRYQAAIALEPTDRIPIATGSNYFAEVYSGNDHQETLYDSDKWLQAELTFCRDFPEVDVLRNNRVWGPLFDAVDLQSYKLPGRDLPPHSPFQFVEKEYMLADEYDLLIKNPLEFMFDRWLPRILGELKERGSARSYMAFLKGGMAQAQVAQIMKNRSLRLQEEVGMPQPMAGAFLAPFDALADAMRGLTGALMDTYRQPDKVIAACDVLTYEMANFALVTADPQKRYPIFVPTHKATFMSPAEFDKFYWPSFKKTMEILIGAGYTIRAYLEGDWGRHWHHFLELPKGKVLCDIDNQGDIFKAKQEIGHHQCIAGGIKDSQFILGTPEEMRKHVKLLCETLGPAGGYIVSGGCNVPHDTKTENYRAMVEAVLEYGIYDRDVKPKPRPAPEAEPVTAFSFPRMAIPWEVKKAELGSVQGEEMLIRKPWEQLESMAYVWLWQWTM